MTWFQQPSKFRFRYQVARVAKWPIKEGFALGWAIHSEIAHAVSDKPTGPYQAVEYVEGKEMGGKISSNVQIPYAGTWY
jgi:hypothetical protein